MGSFNVFNPAERLFRKAVKQTKKQLGNFTRTITGGNTDSKPQVESQADIFAREEKEQLEARRRAMAGLTQTSTLGSGTPQTTRKSVLGV